MGSGRGGGGGGGSGGGGGGGSGGGGGGSGSGGGGGGFGGYRYKNGQLVTTTPNTEKMRKTVSWIFKKLSREYLIEQFANPSLKSVYEQLFLLHVDLLQNKSWSGIQKRYGVDPSPGCLSRLAAALLNREPAADPTIEKHLGLALEDFLMLAVGDDPASLIRYSGDQVVKKADPKVLGRLSNEFFGEYVYQVLRSEPSVIPPDSEIQLRDVASDVADEIIGKFEGKFKDKGQITYRHLVQTIIESQDWFIKAIRK